MQDEMKAFFKNIQKRNDVTLDVLTKGGKVKNAGDLPALSEVYAGVSKMELYFYFKDRPSAVCQFLLPAFLEVHNLKDGKSCGLDRRYDADFILKKTGEDYIVEFKDGTQHGTLMEFLVGVFAGRYFVENGELVDQSERLNEKAKPSPLKVGGRIFVEHKRFYTGSTRDIFRGVLTDLAECSAGKRYGRVRMDGGEEFWASDKYIRTLGVDDIIEAAFKDGIASVDAVALFRHLHAQRTNNSTSYCGVSVLEDGEEEIQQFSGLRNLSGLMTEMSPEDGIAYCTKAMNALVAEHPKETHDRISVVSTLYAHLVGKRFEGDLSEILGQLNSSNYVLEGFPTLSRTHARVTHGEDARWRGLPEGPPIRQNLHDNKDVHYEPFVA